MDPCRYKTDFARRSYYEGYCEGAAVVILAVLEAREIAPSNQARARISECTDVEQLFEWGRRAATADSIEEVLG